MPHKHIGATFAIKLFTNMWMKMFRQTINERMVCKSKMKENVLAKKGKNKWLVRKINKRKWSGTGFSKMCIMHKMTENVWAGKNDICYISVKNGLTPLPATNYDRPFTLNSKKLKVVSIAISPDAWLYRMKNKTPNSWLDPQICNCPLAIVHLLSQAHLSQLHITTTNTSDSCRW